MDALTHADLDTLLADHDPPCVSLYAPTHPSGREGESDPLRLRNLVDEAEERVKTQVRRSVEAREFLTPLRELATDETLWHDRSEGLAVFLSSDLSQTFRLPLHFAPRVSVGARFVIRPLLPLLVQNDRFLVLTVSQHRVRLLEGNRSRLVLREASGLPARMDESVIATDQGRKQMHIGGADPTHRHSAIYHGHGGKPDARKSEIAGFLRTIIAPLHAVLRDEHAPLVLAGVTSLSSMFREIVSYPGLAPQQLEANCDRLSDSELHQQVWPIVEEISAADRKRQTERAYAAANPARWVRDVHVILPAADQGRIELLLMARDADLFGAYDSTRGESAVRIVGEGNDDLVDLAAAHTLKHRGKVFVLDREEVPGCGDLAAVLRQ